MARASGLTSRTERRPPSIWSILAMYASTIWRAVASPRSIQVRRVLTSISSTFTLDRSSAMLHLPSIHVVPMSSEQEPAFRLGNGTAELAGSPDPLPGHHLDVRQG